jgi:hypothetical protein
MNDATFQELLTDRIFHELATLDWVEAEATRIHAANAAQLESRGKTVPFGGLSLVLKAQTMRIGLLKMLGGQRKAQAPATASAAPSPVAPCTASPSATGCLPEPPPSPQPTQLPPDALPAADGNPLEAQLPEAHAPAAPNAQAGRGRVGGAQPPAGPKAGAASLSSTSAKSNPSPTALYANRAQRRAHERALKKQARKRAA